MWKVVKQITNPNSNNNGLKKFANQFDDLHSCAEHIATHFESCFTQRNNIEIDKLLLEMATKTKKTFWLNIATEQVQTLLSNLDTSKSTGSDGLPASLLRIACVYLSAPITHIFCLCVE